MNLSVVGSRASLSNSERKLTFFFPEEIIFFLKKKYFFLKKKKFKFLHKVLNKLSVIPKVISTALKLKESSSATQKLIFVRYITTSHILKQLMLLRLRKILISFSGLYLPFFFFFLERFWYFSCASFQGLSLCFWYL